MRCTIETGAKKEHSLFALKIDETLEASKRHITGVANG
jgi:hypothetical protein